MIGQIKSKQSNEKQCYKYSNEVTNSQIREWLVK